MQHHNYANCCYYIVAQWLHRLRNVSSIPPLFATAEEEEIKLFELGIRLKWLTRTRHDFIQPENGRGSDSRLCAMLSYCLLVAQSYQLSPTYIHMEDWLSDLCVLVVHPSIRRRNSAVTVCITFQVWNVICNDGIFGRRIRHILKMPLHLCTERRVMMI